jgi:hypothetical protein
MDIKTWYKIGAKATNATNLQTWYIEGPKRKGDGEDSGAKKAKGDGLTLEQIQTLKDVITSNAHPKKYQKAKLHSAFSRMPDQVSFEEAIKGNWDMFKLYMEKYEGMMKDYTRWSEKTYPKGSKESKAVLAHFHETFEMSLVDANNFGKKVNAFVDASSLTNQGVGCIEVIAPSQIEGYIRRFLQTEQSFPEYAENDYKIFVLGGFAAFGNPTSFHNPLVKELRKLAYEKLRDSQILIKYLQRFRPERNPSDYKLDILFDRMMHRAATQSPSVETAHRDITPIENLIEADDDMMFGGWINISKNVQYFIAKPGSHVDAKNSFSVVKDYEEGFSSISQSSKEFLHYLRDRRMFPIQPGHMVIFPQHILHEVMATSGTEQMRLFTGWRLTLGTKCLFHEAKKKAIETIGPVRMPSSQEPPMVAGHHLGALKNKAIKWLGDVKPGSSTKLVDVYGRTYTSPVDAADPQGTPNEWFTSTMHPIILRHRTNPTSPERYLKSLAEYNRLNGDESTNFNLTPFVYTDDEKRFMLSLHSIVPNNDATYFYEADDAMANDEDVEVQERVAENAIEQQERVVDEVEIIDLTEDDVRIVDPPLF